MRRNPRRARYDQDSVYRVLDRGRVAHVSFCADGQPYGIPVLYARAADEVLIHGSSASRMIRLLASGAPACVTVTILDGLVLARSAFEHSANYDSVMLLGRFRPLSTDEQKLEALRAFMEIQLPGRWSEVRAPTAQELKATAILALPIREASVKTRSGPPDDDGSPDAVRDVWAGVIPIVTGYGQPQPSPGLRPGTSTSPSVDQLTAPEAPCAACAMGSEQHASGGMAELEDRLTARALTDGDPAGWFERFYRAAAAGEVELPWDRAEPHRLLTRWAAERRLDGSGRRAIVVGCGPGADAEYVARLGFQVVAFDIAETAIRLARQRYPGSAVRYQAADLLQPPGEWQHAFDLVVEITTAQALPDPPQRQAIVNAGRLVRPGGTLVVVEAARGEHERAPELGPWPLSRADIDAFGTDGLLPVGIELAVGPGGPADLHWLAEFRRPRGSTGINAAHRNRAQKPRGDRHDG